MVPGSPNRGAKAVSYAVPDIIQAYKAGLQEGSGLVHGGGLQDAQVRRLEAKIADLSEQLSNALAAGDRTRGNPGKASFSDDVDRHG